MYTFDLLFNGTYTYNFRNIILTHKKVVNKTKITLKHDPN